MRPLVWLALLLLLDLLSISAIQAEAPRLRGSLDLNHPPIRKVYP